MKNIIIIILSIFSTLLSYSQQTSRDTLHWSASRKLDWKDFAKPAGKTGVLGHAVMIMNAKFHKGLKATTSVDAVFDRNSSFISNEEKTAQMLKYYQTMFDLYEVQSRKLRKEFKATKFGLNPEVVFQEKYNAALKELDERIDLYMEETETGENAAELEKWSQAVLLELKTL